MKLYCRAYIKGNKIRNLHVNTKPIVQEPVEPEERGVKSIDFVLEDFEGPVKAGNVHKEMLLKGNGKVGLNTKKNKNFSIGRMRSLGEEEKKETAFSHFESKDFDIEDG